MLFHPARIRTVQAGFDRECADVLTVTYSTRTRIGSSGYAAAEHKLAVYLSRRHRRISWESLKRWKVPDSGRTVASLAGWQVENPLSCGEVAETVMSGRNGNGRIMQREADSKHSSMP